jgi:hypothetical protein
MRRGPAVRGFLKHFAPDEFRPDEISILEDALDDAWRRVEQSKAPWASEDYSTAGRTILARYIITMAKGGERDAKWLADSALLYLSQQKLTRTPPDQRLWSVSRRSRTDAREQTHEIAAQSETSGRTK